MLTIVGVALFVPLVFLSGGLGGLASRLYDRVDLLSGRNYFGIGPLLIAATGASRLVAEERWPPRPATASTLAFGTFLCLFTGSKANLLAGLLLAGIIVGWVRSDLTMAKALAALAILIVAAGGYNLTFRDAFPRHVSIAEAVRQRGGLATAFGYDFIGNTFFGHQALVLAVSEVPAHHAYFGTYSLRATLVAPVPHGFYPGKPEALAGPFTELFAPRLRKLGTTIPPTFLGEWYLSWGPTGLVCATFLFGLLSHSIYNTRTLSARWFLFSAIFSASLLHVIRGDTLASFVFLAVMSVPIIAVIPRRLASPMGPPVESIDERHASKPVPALSR